MYAVAAQPINGGNLQKGIAGAAAGTPRVLNWLTTATGPRDRTTLNLGSEIKRNLNTTNLTDDMYYMKTPIYPHHRNNVPRWFGPSSGHTGIVQHGFADGHGRAINDDVGREVYLHLVTRAGGEVVDNSDLQ
jgi:hypothetical protein